MSHRQSAREIMQTRNRSAQALGWRSYGQKVYWESEFRKNTPKAANRLAHRIEPGPDRRLSKDDLPDPEGRPGSVFSKTVDLIVNGAGSVPSPLRARYRPGPPEAWTWQIRLVRAAVDGLRA